MNPWIDKIYKPFNKVIGIDIQCLANNEYRYYYCVFKNQNKQLILLEQKEQIHNLDLFIKEYKDIPLCINISGNGILLKKNSVELSDIKSIYAQIPNIDTSQFYWHYESFTNESWTAIAKQSTIDNIKPLFSSCSIVAITLGALSVKYVLDENLKQSPILNHSYTINHSNDTIDLINHNNDKITQEYYNLAGERVLKNNIIAFSSVVKYFAGSTDITHNTDMDVINNYTYKVIFNKSLLYASCAILFSLLINVFMFINSSNKIESLQTKVGNASDKLLVDSLQNIVSTKGAFMKNAGWSESSKTSYYADRIAKSVDNSNIKLTDLNIYPINEVITDTLTFRHQLIQITGISKNAYDVNEWKKKVEQESWAKKVNLNDFTFANDNNYAIFSIIIEL